MSRHSGARLIIIILAILLNPFFYSLIMAQNVMWAKSGISPGFENGNAIVADDSGNVYVTGQFEFTTVFDQVSLYSDGSHDIFVAKYSTTGSLLWIKKAGGISGDIGLGIGIDSLHNVYITGEVEDTVNFGHGISVISAGSNDIFIAKYDASGNIMWANCYGSSAGSDKGRALAVSPSGNCYVTGNFTLTTVFGNVTLNTNGGNDIFVARINTNGVVQWAKKAGGANQDRGYGIAIDRDENVFVTGTFALSATFKNTTITNDGKTSSFIAKYDSSGSFQWVTATGTCCDTTKANSIALDEAGNIYIAGSFNLETKFDNFDFISAGMGDIFLAKYNSSGVAQWARRAGSVNDDGAYGVAVDNKNHTVYVTGMIGGTSQFENQTIPIAGFLDIFVAAYDSNGDLRWVQNHGSYLRDAGAAITTGSDGYIYSTGLYNGNASFGSIMLSGYPNEPWSEFYVNKISPAPAEIPLAANSINVIPENCFDLSVNVVPGNGDGRIIIARAQNQTGSIPQNGISYSSDSIYGNGSDLGNGNYVVYAGSSDHVTVTGLTSGAQYEFVVYEYNGYGLARVYNTNMAPAMSAQSATYSINISGVQSSVCEGQSMTLIASGAVTYEWSPADGLSSTTAAMVQATPLISNRYNVTGQTANGCLAQTSFYVNVNPLPVISFASLSPVCGNAQSITLNVASPAGGTWSGAGVTGNQFNPSLVSQGNINLQYSYTDNIGCSSTASTGIMVNSYPSLQLGNDLLVCAGDIAIVNAGPGYNTYLWSNGSSSASIAFDSSGTGLATKNLFVEVSNSYGCKNRDSINVTFDLCAGIKENKISTVSLFPNPFQKSFTIPNLSGAAVSIYDVSGRAIHQSVNVNGDYMFSERIAPGTYYVQITEDGVRKTLKVICTE